MANPSFYIRIGRLSSVVLVLPSSMAAGWFLGRFVFDRFLATYPWGTIGFVFLGAAAGFYEIVKMLMSDQRSKND